MQKVLATIACLCCSLLSLHPLLAQVPANITGVIKESAQQPVSKASVSLLKGGDSSLVKLALSDEQGLFRFSGIPAGQYRIHVTMVGFAPYTSATTELAAGQQLAFPAIILQPAATATLSGVTVTARRPLIEKRIDRTIVNVEAMTSSAGTNALELLERAPGIAVDENGIISLNGKQGALVLIDDKPTYLSGEALANYLRSLPSSVLDKIELMSNPPAKYDAAGNAGVINIRTKKIRSRGFNGSLSTAFNQGKLFSTTNSAVLNYRTGNLNVFANVSYLLQNGFTDLDIHRTYKNNQGATTSYFLQNSYIKRHSESVNAKLGMDYTLSKRTTLGLVLSSLNRPSTRNTINTSQVLDPHLQADSTITADNRENNKWRNLGLNLNARHDLNSNGRAITADLDYITYTSGIHQMFYNNTFRRTGTPHSSDELAGRLPSDIAIYASKIDYTHPMAGNLVLEGGLKTSYIHTDNLAEYFATVENVTSPDYDKTNHFIYKENIHAGYINATKDAGRLSLKAGLRVENTLSRGHQLGNAVKSDSAFKRSYTDFFPTLYVSYKLDTLNKHQLNLSYGRRIDRPFYQDLNPFISPLDKFTLYAGNPFLKPSFTNEVSVAHTFKNLLTTTVFYSYTKDVAMEAISLNGNNYLSQPANLGTNSILGLSVNAGLKPTKWWTSNIYAEVQNRHYEGRLYGGYLDTSAVYFGTNISNQFRINKSWNAELGGTYRTGVVVGQVSLASLWQMNAGIQKKIWNNKGTVKLAVRDIFYSGIRNGIIHNLYQAHATFRNKGDLRIYSLSFTLNFGKMEQGTRNRSRGSAQNEQGRVREG